MVVFPRYKPNFLKYLISFRLFFLISVAAGLFK